MSQARASLHALTDKADARTAIEVFPVDIGHFAHHPALDVASRSAA